MSPNIRLIWSKFKNVKNKFPTLNNQGIPSSKKFLFLGFLEKLRRSKKFVSNSAGLLQLGSRMPSLSFTWTPVSLTSSVTLAVFPVLSGPRYPPLPTAGLLGRDKRDTPYVQFTAQRLCCCAHGVTPGECPHPALRCCCRTRSVTAKLNKPQNHPETCLKYRPLGPNLGLLVWDVQGQDLRSCTVKQSPQGFQSQRLRGQGWRPQHRCPSGPGLQASGSRLCGPLEVTSAHHLFSDPPPGSGRVCADYTGRRLSSSLCFLI